jgi:hypothetical protein
MNFTLQQILDMPHVFSRQRVLTDKKYNMDDLTSRCQVLAKKKLDAAGDLKISHENAAQYSEIATAMENAVARLERKFKGFECCSSPASKGIQHLITLEYDQTLEKFICLNEDMYDNLGDAKHIMDSIHKIRKSLPTVDPRVHKDLSTLEFIN